MYAFFDIVGDVHGCLDELLELMGLLGYKVQRHAQDFTVALPAGRKLAFVGDLVNRGPSTIDVLRLVMGMVRESKAFCVSGNHDARLFSAIEGDTADAPPDVLCTLEQLDGEPPAFRAEVETFLAQLPSYCFFDEGRLAIVHAELNEESQRRTSSEVREVALHGETTGKSDGSGRPVRRNWAMEYRGTALVVFGHTPVKEPLWLNSTVNIDTGCVYGGHLTALRYPEHETVSVAAKAIYYQSNKSFLINEELA